ncbi:MAG: hypothetical protein Q7S08_01680 [bacterium]|nr:hypothetical protein [bacterium]
MAKLTSATTPEREGRERALVQQSQEFSMLPFRGASEDRSPPAIWVTPPPKTVLDALAECPGFSGRFIRNAKKTSG